VLSQNLKRMSRSRSLQKN